MMNSGIILRRIAYCLAPALMAALSAASPALAHEFSTSYSIMKVDGARVQEQFLLGVIDLHAGPRIDLNNDGVISIEEIEQGVASVLAAVQDHYRVEAAEDPASRTVESYEIVAASVVRINFLYTFSEDVKDLRITSSLDRITQDNHRHLLILDQGDHTLQGILDATNPVLEIAAGGRTTIETAWDFLKLGVEHIITGYDHLAFLAGLLLTTSTLLSLVKVVTSFTVAHSVTLGLATFNIVVMPQRFIESLIALSIAYIAVETFTGAVYVNRWKITFLFGLVHGFGFSNILREMELTRMNLAVSLFSFNAGVEVGQIAFVCAVFPAIYLVMASRWKEHFLSAASLAIMSLGFYWFVQRAFLM